MIGVRNTDTSTGVHPYMHHPPYAVWSIWRSCGWLYRIVLVLIGSLTVYSLLLAVVTVVRLRSISAKLNPNPDLTKNSVLALHRHWGHIRQATLVIFYFFGLVLFLALQYIGVIFGDGGPYSAGQRILDNFTLACAFATNAFAGFLIVQIAQWIASGRIIATLEEFDGRKP